MGQWSNYLGNCLRYRSEIPLSQWANGFLKLPQSVRCPIFLTSESNWWTTPLDAISELARNNPNPSVPARVDIRGPVGSAKSLVGEIFISWIIENMPGFTYYVWQTDDDGTDAMEDRVLPMFEANDFLFSKLPLDRHAKRKAKISFIHMPLYIVGANPNSAQSKRVKFLIMEEPHLYDSGMMSAMEKRCEGVKNAVIVTLSTGSLKDDESDKSFEEGSREEWEVPCPHCGLFQPPCDHPDRLKGKKDETTINPDGSYKWDKYLESVTFNCVDCQKEWPNTEEFRKEQSQKGKYRVTNPDAKSTHRSFHIESAAIYWTSFRTIVEEKVKAAQSAKMGNLELLKDYVQKRKALAWDDSPPDTSTADINRIKGGFLKNDPFPEAIARFLIFDNQAGISAKQEGEHRWFSVWGFSQTEMRLLDEGRLGTWEECEEYRIKAKIPPEFVWVDMAYDSARVQGICVRYGWKGLWGDNQERSSFPFHEQVNGQKVTRHYPYSPPQLGHVRNSGSGIQRQAVYRFWCKQPIAQLYFSLKDGITTYDFKIPQDVSEDWINHQNTLYKAKIFDKKGNVKWIWQKTKGNRPNHLLDCALMALVAALMHPDIRPILYAFSDELVNLKPEE